MKEIAKSIGEKTIYCRSNILAGVIKKYHFLIKYDNQSSVYTLTFGITLDKDISKLTKLIKSKEKDAIISYNNKTLKVVGSVTDKKYLKEIINPILIVISNYLEKEKVKEVCLHCKEEKKVFLVDNDEEISFCCEDCYETSKKASTYKKEKYNKSKENIFLGIIGSLIGTIPGILLWLLFSYLNIEPGIAGIAITMGSAVGYKKGAKNIKTTGIIISTIIGLFMVFVAHELRSTIYIYNLYKNEYYITLFDAYKAIPYYLNTIKDFHKLFTSNLITGYILSIIGVFTSYSLQRQNNNTYEIRKIGGLDD